ncbi:NADH:ubiquinone reductase (Na(+)-transporting) subunit C [Crocinitomicaceae bacterium]|nr:NADH:ubiquinone reductase (Na(+)-transporting) subunit C [Crocinitomicaceae bacterium]MDC1194144.1 NADH:ubiquinone reductase (Na(+)-transporting) subunit C [Crocinitomicaceae bacterium]
MAINKESAGYTFAFATALVVVVGTTLALLSMGLKDRQDQNEVVKKKMDILKAMLTQEEGDKISRKNADAEFNKYIDLKDAIVLNSKGEKIDGDAFKVDIRKEIRDKKLPESKRNYPLFIGKKDGKTVYIAPVVGNGLWGPIWGNICIGEDMKSIQGASFGHKGETPGLGAEITQQFFIDRWIGETISDDSGNFAKFEIVKDGSGPAKQQKVDGITGGTITSKGVEEMANRCMEVYVSYFKSKN